MSKPASPSTLAGPAFAAALVGYGTVTAFTVRPAAIRVLAGVATGEVPGGWNGAYALVVSWAHAVLGFLGGSVYGTATALSVIGGALTVAATAAVAQGTGLARRDAVFATALVGTCPAVVSLATQPGSAALGAGCAALAAAALVSWLRRPRPTAGIALAVVGAAGVALHQGDLLVPLALVAVWFERRVRASLPGVALFAVLVLVGAASWSEPCREVIGKGWLRAFVPLSLLWLLALLRPATRPSAAVQAVALIVGLGLGTAHGAGAATDGGPLLCLVLPLALLGVRAASPGVLRAAVVVGLVVSVARVAAEDESTAVRAWANGLHEVVTEPAKARVIVRDESELGFAVAGAGDVECATVEDFVAQFEVAAEREFYTQKIEAVLEAGLSDLLQQGYRVYLTQGAEDVLRDIGFRVRHHVAVRMFDHLRARFSLVQVAALGFRAKRIEPRS